MNMKKQIAASVTLLVLIFLHMFLFPGQRISFSQEAVGSKVIFGVQ